MRGGDAGAETNGAPSPDDGNGVRPASGAGLAAAGFIAGGAAGAAAGAAAGFMAGGGAARGSEVLRLPNTVQRLSFSLIV